MGEKMKFDRVFPNPVNDYLQLGHIPYERYTLYDLTGKKVQSGRHQSQINMSSMQRGMYFLVINGWTAASPNI